MSGMLSIVGMMAVTMTVVLALWALGAGIARLARKRSPGQLPTRAAPRGARPAFGAGAGEPPLPASGPAIAGDLRVFVEELGQRAWGTREQARRLDLALDPSCLAGIKGSDLLARRLLAHMRQVAPGLDVPYYEPRIISVSAAGTAGSFREQDGWVTVSLHPRFATDPRVTAAILAHELSHYVLNANGLRKSTTVANERYTEVAMFVLGLGDVFLAGYRQAPRGDHRPGHRVGYLSEEEYRFVDNLAFDRRLNGDGLLGDVASRLITLSARIPDERARARLLEHARLKFPFKSEGELVQLVLDEIERDRR